tara:strand:- start:152 stop:721 length:570 start_codon:yes stop_codon:yes gene_type:complete
MEKRYYINKYSDATRAKPFILKIHLYGNKGKYDYPMVKICVNKKVFFHNRIENNQKLEMQINDIRKKQILSIELTDKKPSDTLVENGKITKDKFLKINKIYIDDVDIKNNIFNGKQKPKYHYAKQGPKFVQGDHLFFQGPWKLFYQNPPKQYFSNLSKLTQLISSEDKKKVKDSFLKKLQNLVYESTNI